MPTNTQAKLTKRGAYKAGLKKGRKKRTTIPTRQQAMSSRHLSPRNTALCPEGHRMINGKCSDASGMDFSGRKYVKRKTMSNIPTNIKPLWEVKEVGDSGLINLSNASVEFGSEEHWEEKLKQVRNILEELSPMWLRPNVVPVDKINKIVEYSNTILIERKQLHALYNKMKRVKTSPQSVGINLLKSSIKMLPLDTQKWISHQSSDNDLFGYGWLIGLIIAGLIYDNNK